MSFSLVYAFFVTLLVSGIIFWIGGRISPRSSPSENKLLPYAGGEKVSHEFIPVNIKMFNYALLFIISEVISLLLVFSVGPSGNTLNYIAKIGVVLYTIIVSLALYVLARRV
jgi:NADH:ubiquinone oxidoreductase subunit 3 (subunit A)